MQHRVHRPPEHYIFAFGLGLVPWIWLALGLVQLVYHYKDSRMQYSGASMARAVFSGIQWLRRRPGSRRGI